MTKNLPSLSECGHAVLNISKAIGPFLLSQSKKASEAYAEHQKRLAKVDAYKELVIGEAHALSEVHQKLLENFYAAPDEERFRIKRDIQDINKEKNRLELYLKAAEYFPKEDDKEPTSSAATNTLESISQSWIDRFDELARLQNEEWRKDLLSRALAREAQRPGSVGPRALWFIGTVDERIFHAFASLIDISSLMGGHVIPNHNKFNKHPVPNCILGETTIGSLTFLLTDLGLLGNLAFAERGMFENKSYKVSYSTKHCMVKTKKEVVVHGIILTDLGEIIASLYEPKFNKLGLEIFDSWIKSITTDVADISSILEI